MFVVRSGPFKGMLMVDKQPWDDGNKAVKIDGSYESCLYPWIEQAIARNPPFIINIGCAEGYYAVGLGRRCPDARVMAVDTSENALEVCAENGLFNGVAIETHGRMLPAELSELLVANPNTLIVMDCEGDEAHLLNPRECPNITRADFIVECHDFMEETTSRNLEFLLRPSHSIAKIGARAIMDEREIRPDKTVWLYGIHN